MPRNFGGKFAQLVWTIIHVLYLFAVLVWHKIITCSFNESVLKKCTDGKAFYIMATLSAQLFATLTYKCLVVFGCLLLPVMKVHDKFASSWQVNSPNSQDKFEICCTIASKFCGILFTFVNFVDFHKICSFMTMQNIRSPVKWISTTSLLK